MDLVYWSTYFRYQYRLVVSETVILIHPESCR